ncbi:unnamed protein product [Cylindrotheca closterium]|uniref:Uncharacterized protein n=1 Tax=Cylindrotheca closterium TaxID=2856 RepID=A0AAD2CLZ4_9STRA|nr:unnamed protein product [Cylindrotheca closterium]
MAATGTFRAAEKPRQLLEVMMKERTIKRATPKLQEEPVFAGPTPLTTDELKDPDLVEIFDDEKAENKARKAVYKSNKKAMYTLVMANISEATKTKVKARNDFTAEDEAMNLVWLIGVLDDIMTGFEEGVLPDEVAMDKQLTKITTMRQKPDESNEAFIKKITREIKVYERHGGVFRWGENEEKKLEAAVANANDVYKSANGQDMGASLRKETIRQQKKIIKERILAAAILTRSDDTRFKSLMTSLKNDFLTKVDRFPKSVASTMKLLDNYISPSHTQGSPRPQPRPRGGARRSTSVAFLQTSGNDQLSTLTEPRSHKTLLQLLNRSESTDNIFQNKEFLTDVKQTTNGESLRLVSNGGSLDTTQKGLLGNLPVWFNPNCLANILSLALVTEHYRVTMDSDIDNALLVHVSAGYIMRFVCIDMSKLKKAFCFVNTVAMNKRLFKQRDIRKADEAITLNRRINHVAKDKFARIVKNNWIRNCPVTINDVERSHVIYAPPVPPIKGRTRYQSSSRVPDTEVIPIPKGLYMDLKNVTVCADFYYVDTVAVFHTISRKLDYRTVSFPLSRSKTSIVSEIAEMCKRIQGFPCYRTTRR